ncbi:MAG: hypothetical protein ACRDHZ_16695 [Ktedonobacteraceae bacterium]
MGGQQFLERPEMVRQPQSHGRRLLSISTPSLLTLLFFAGRFFSETPWGADSPEEFWRIFRTQSGPLGSSSRACQLTDASSSAQSIVAGLFQECSPFPCPTFGTSQSAAASKTADACLIASSFDTWFPALWGAEWTSSLCRPVSRKISSERATTSLGERSHQKTYL